MRRFTMLFVISMLAFAATATAASKSPFKPGLYVGKTSQGHPVKLRLTVGGPECGGKPCLFAPNDRSEIYVAESCTTAGDSTNEYLAVFGVPVPASGVVHVNGEAFSKVTSTLKIGHGGTLTGKVRATTTLADGSRCDSGPVTFSAKIGGSTR